jgi:hypothetical protein
MSAASTAERDLRRWAEVLLADGAVVELRGLNVPARYGKPMVASGYFDADHVDEFVAAAHILDERGAKGVYATINPVNPALLARAANRVIDRPASTTSDTDIVRRRLLLIDLDPRRPAGISSTDEERAQAARVADEIEAFLGGLGWPLPWRVDTGNGVALYYGVNEPSDDDGLIGRVLEVLDVRFANEHVSIDLTVKNPARIARVPGTTNRKGDATPDRPHRVARIVREPDAAEEARG